MNVTCSQCHTVFRVDPAKVPQEGVRARCSVCGGVFEVTHPAAEAAVQAARAPAPSPAAARSPAPPASPPAAAPRPPKPTPRPAEAARVTPAAGAAGAPPFAQTDTDARARRLARALISDLITYHPELQERGLRDNKLKELFREEIRKSWREYVEQVGTDVAKNTPYFRDALNEILAKGQKIF